MMRQLFLFAVVFLGVGCGGISTASHNRDTELTFHSDGTVTGKSSVHSDAEARPPVAASQPSVAEADTVKSKAVVSPSWQTVAADAIKLQKGKIFYSFAGFFLLSTVGLVFAKKYIPAGIALLCALLCIAAPRLEPYLTAIFVTVIVLAIIAGAWLLAQWLQARALAKKIAAEEALEEHRAAKTIASLGRKAIDRDNVTDTRELIAAIRTSDPVIDSAFKGEA